MGAPVTWVTPNPTTGVDQIAGTAANPIQTSTAALQTTNDLTKIIVAPIVTATTTTIVAAAASVRTRVYRMRVDVAGANIISFTDSTGAEKRNFAASGGFILDFSTRPWFTTAVNTAFTVTTSTTAEVNITCEYTRVA